MKIRWRSRGLQGSPPGLIEGPRQLAADALRECREMLTPSMQNHSLRTFVFGLALANLDAVRLDVDQLYVASLLHDLALGPMIAAGALVDLASGRPSSRTGPRLGSSGGGSARARCVG